MLEALPSGLFNMATGSGGLTGLAKGVEQGLTRAMSGGNSWAAAFVGAGMGNALGRSRGGAVAGAEGATMAEAAESGGLVKLGDAVAAASGLKWFIKNVPWLAKLGTAFVGADVYAMDKFTQDVFSRSRRAGGFGTNMGAMTSFESTMNRFVDPDNMLKAATQSMYDITSPAYTAMRIAGINPAEWKDPTALAEGTIAAVQREMKGFKGNRETMLTMAHAHKFQNLGLSDEDLMRLATGDQKDVNDLLKRAQKEAKSMDLSQDQIKNYQDLYTETSLATQELKTFGEIIQNNTIPFFKGLDDTIMDTTKHLESGHSLQDYVAGAKNRVSVEDKTMLDWFKQHFGDIGIDPLAAAGSIDTSGTLGGAPRSIRRRMTGKGQINYPAGGPRGKGSAGFGLFASDIGLVASKGLPPEEAAFLDTLGTGETPRGSYSNRSGDPGGLGGRYQFLLSTWNKEASKAGVDPKDFSPENQDKVAWFYASEEVKRRTGQDLMSLLKSGPEGTRKAISALSPGIWNAITNIDPDKSGHSNAIKLFQKKLQDEQNAIKARQAAPSDKQSNLIMNDMSNFQRDKKLAMTIHNAAGANYAVHGAMLGSGSGNYGSYS